MKILILGGSGFIGSNLVEYLKDKNIDFLATYSKNNLDNLTNFVKYKIGNKLPKKIINFEPTVIIALAWHGIPILDEKNSKINYKMYKNFLIELDKLIYLKKIIFAGSCSEYEIKKNKKNELSEENFKLSKSHFSIAKDKVNSIYTNYCKKNKISFIWLRIFFIYGKYQRKNSIIPFIIDNLNKKRTTFLNEPNKSVDFIHISDLILLLFSILKYKKYLIGNFNCGSGKSYKILEIYNLISRELVSNIKYDTDLNNNDYTTMYANVQKTAKYFKWYPKLSIKAGIKKVLDEKN